MQPFSFEHPFTFSEDLYVQLNSIFKRKSRPLRIGAALLVGAACLFFSHTIVLGFVILTVASVGLFAPAKIPKFLHNTYQKCVYIHDPLTYGVSDKELWVSGEKISVRMNWELASVWEQRQSWLRVSCNHTPSVWFPVKNLVDADVYEHVLKLCRKHAKKYNDTNWR